jgi:hypothetical protein
MIMRHIIWLTLSLLILSRAATAQSCNPASVYYIVRDDKGSVVSAAELTAIAAQLPKQIGDATTGASEVSFAPDKRTFYWPEDVDFGKGTKMPALLFSNAATCTMHLGDVTLLYRGKTMRLIFDIDINRTQDDRHQVIDSLRLQNGTFRLNLKSWTKARDKIIPAIHWKRFGARSKEQ